MRLVLVSAPPAHWGTGHRAARSCSPWQSRQAAGAAPAVLAPGDSGSSQSCTETSAACLPMSVAWAVGDAVSAAVAAVDGAGLPGFGTAADAVVGTRRWLLALGWTHWLPSTVFVQAVRKL